MSIGTTVSAPTPARTTLPPPRGSRLNPASSRPDSSLRPSTSTTLSNLDRLLLKQQSTSPPPLQQQQQYPHLGRSASTIVEDDSKPSTSREHRSRSNSIFNALNLNTIIPSLRNPATEAMSPRSLTNLQRLLESPRPSPKSSITSRWRLFHGSHDWAGLLDPLDENLRRELVRYGEFVQAAYHAFHSNPAAQPSQKRHVILNDRSYRVTKSLYATSSVELPEWLDGVAPWMTQRTSWIGYVAVCDNAQEIQRMGRRDIVISLRGTSTCMEWAENVRAGLVPLEGSQEDDIDIESKQHHHHQPKVANGFYSLYKTRGKHVPSLSETVIAEVRRLMEQYEGEELSISITGHSLGAALALFVADELSMCLPNVPPTAVFSFGGPKVGNKAFEDRLARNRVKVLRVVNASDVITRMPGVLPREELGRRLPEKWGSHVLEGMDTYVHVGSELRVDSKASPYLRPNADPACCHDLESYLHLVDGFMGSACPFRSDAKRSLVRLLDQQRPNVKRLYVSQAKMLGLDRFEPAGLASPSMTGCLASPSA